MAFRDVLDITVQAGKGGDGAMSFLRLKYIAKGGPDGGHGGDGGSVYLEAIDDLSSLDRLVDKRHFKAPNGRSGEGRNKAGARGEELTIMVPVGTMARDLDTGELVADLLTAGERVLIAKGGLGGRGNESFANSRRRSPRFAEYGTPGERRRLRLELRTIADVGLVGYPNAGKSSLLAALSNAKPEIASYPFTTLSPNLGVIERGLERLTMADIPGIIEDAHLGKGLGLEFLRHISRTRLLIYVLDIAEEASAHLEALQHELEAHDPLLLTRTGLIVLNKIDLANATEVDEIINELTSYGLPIIAVSALEGYNLETLKDSLFALLPEKVMPEQEKQVMQVTVKPTKVQRDPSGLGWLVTGDDIERVVSRFDPSNPEAVAYLQHHFAALGINKMLKAAGAVTGDEVQIVDAVFDYFDEDATQEATHDQS